MSSRLTFASGRDGAAEASNTSTNLEATMTCDSDTDVEDVEGSDSIWLRVRLGVGKGFTSRRLQEVGETI